MHGQQYKKFTFVFVFVLSDNYPQKVMYAQTQFPLTHIHIIT